MVITKRDIAKQLSPMVIGISKAEDVITRVMVLIRDELNTGNEVHLRGFGTFKTKMVKGKKSNLPTFKGRIPDKVKVRFIASKKFIQARGNAR